MTQIYNILVHVPYLMVLVRVTFYSYRMSELRLCAVCLCVLWSWFYVMGSYFGAYVVRRYLGNNSLAGPLPAASLGSLVNLEQLYAHYYQYLKALDVYESLVGGSGKG